MKHFTIPMRVVGVTFGVERSRDWQAIKPDWDRVFCGRRQSVFQSTRWLTAWYDALAGQPNVEPFLLTVRNLQTGLVALYLPLSRRTVNGVRRVEFADLGRTIYNAPLLGPAAPTEPEAATAMWRDLRSALRGWGVDLVSLQKMPVHISGAPNPLALMEPVRASSRFGNLITLGDDLDAYRLSTKK
jgi:CelD/BcsL family acetyltransferase involved in cellulose biosynthesis